MRTGRGGGGRGRKEGSPLATALAGLIATVETLLALATLTVATLTATALLLTAAATLAALAVSGLLGLVGAVVRAGVRLTIVVA